jgi:hypothetical protein
MSEFSTAMAVAWDPAVQVFGEKLVFDGSATQYDCVIHSLDLTNEVQPGRPGRTVILSGRVAMRATDWTASAAAKGSRLTVGGTPARIINDPDIGFGSDTAILELGPLN